MILTDSRKKPCTMYVILKRCKIGLLHKQLSIFSKFCMIDFKIYSFGHFGRPKPSFVPGISGMPETLPDTSMPETLPTLVVYRFCLARPYLARTGQLLNQASRSRRVSSSLRRVALLAVRICRALRVNSSATHPVAPLSAGVKAAHPHLH